MRLCMLLVFASCATGPLAAQQREYVAGEIENGRRLYESSCTGCHGPEGDGVAGVNFGAGRFRRSLTDDELARAIVRGIPGTPMPPSSFSEGQAGTVVAYLRSMSASGARSAAPPGDEGRGKVLFGGKGQCFTCHSVNGLGSRVGPNLTESGSVRRAVELERSMLEPDAEIRAENRSVRVLMGDGATITGRLLNQDSFSLQLLDSNERLVSLVKSNLREHAVLKNSPMPSYRDKLTSQELADVVSYLVSLKGRF